MIRKRYIALARLMTTRCMSDYDRPTASSNICTKMMLCFRGRDVYVGVGAHFRATETGKGGLFVTCGHDRQAVGAMTLGIEPECRAINM